MGLAICKEEDHEAKKDDPVERNTLKDLFISMNGNQWIDYWKKNWGSSKSIKEWKGVEVDRNHHVVCLDCNEERQRDAHDKLG